MEDFALVMASVGKIINWLPKILEIFKPFKPEITHFQINYKQKKAILYYRLDIDNVGIRRKIGKIEIPYLPSYRILNFFDEGFSNLNHLIKVSKDQRSYIIKTNQLPSCRYFQVTLKGNIEPRALENIIRIQPTINKNNTPSYDRYWLDVMIRDTDALEKIYRSLEVNDVNCSVKVSTERYFATELPKSLVRGIKAMNEFLSAGRTADRQKLFQKWQKYRKSYKIDKEELVKYFENLMDSFNLQNYLKVDEPFYLGEIGNIDTYEIIPSNFAVDAITNLSFRKPAASGYLQFHKKSFQNKLRDEIKEKWE